MSNFKIYALDFTTNDHGNGIALAVAEGVNGAFAILQAQGYLHEYDTYILKNGREVGVSNITQAVLLYEEATGYQITISPGKWGGIIGNISDQTDLQNALDAKLSIEDAPIEGGLGDNSAVLKDSTNVATGESSVAIGKANKATDETAFATGYGTEANGKCSTTQGNETIADGDGSHAEGNQSKTSEDADAAHAEGYQTVANGTMSHAEGNATMAGVGASHAEGQGKRISVKLTGAANVTWYTVDSDVTVNETMIGCRLLEDVTKYIVKTASNNRIVLNSTLGSAKSSSSYTIISGAFGTASHVEGFGTITNNYAEHAEGKFNKSNGTTLSSIGIGTSTERKNAFEVLQNGDIYLYGMGNYGGTSLDNAVPINGAKSVTSDFFDRNLSSDELAIINSTSAILFNNKIYKRTECVSDRISDAVLDNHAQTSFIDNLFSCAFLNNAEYHDVDGVLEIDTLDIIFIYRTNSDQIRVGYCGIDVE